MFTGSVNVTEPPWPSRVKKLEAFPSYSLAQMRISASLASLQAEQHRIETDALRLQALHDQRVTKQIEDREKKLKETALEQQRQIKSLEEAKARNAVAKKEPGISPFLSGYPNIPLTPPDIRLQRKLEQQHFLKSELELQAEKRKAVLAVLRAEDQRQTFLMLSAAEQIGQGRQQQDEAKRKQNREEMRSSWEQASSFKAAQSEFTSPTRSVAGSAVSQHGWSEYAEKFQEFRPVLAISQACSQTIPASSPSQKVPPGPTSPSSPQVNGSIGIENRKKIAMQLKAREDQRAQASLQTQLSKGSPKRSPQLRQAGTLISRPAKTLGASRSRSQPHLVAKTKQKKPFNG